MMDEPAADAVRFSDALCSWRLVHGRRNLPWFTPDPYKRWLSEIMLQQTQVAVVVDYFERFLRVFPTVEALARASEEDVMRLWAGLGYYSRARNLHKAAQQVAAAGAFPQTSAGWQKLPGVGPSTAAALASFCNGEAAAVCDGNVKRVLARIFAVREPVNAAGTGRRLQELAQSLVSRTDPAGYNQAMMDLGAMLCTRTRPRCEACPVQDFCRAFHEGNPEAYPVKSAASAVRQALVHALLCVEKDRVWLVRRSTVQKGLGHWKGLWTLPEAASAAGAEVARIRHVMSHVVLTLVVHEASRAELPEEAFAVSKEELAQAPLPAPVAKLLKRFFEGPKAV